MGGGAGRIRLIFAAVALGGTALPVAFVIHWPGEIPFFLLMVGALVVPLLLYVSLLRTRILSIATGIGLALVAVGLPIPGYPQFFGGGGVGGWGYALLAIPPLCFAIWATGMVLDLVVRAGRRLGGAVRRAAEEAEEAEDSPPVPVVARPGVAVGWVHAPEIVVEPPAGDTGPWPGHSITVEYVTPPSSSTVDSVIDGELLDRD